MPSRNIVKVMGMVRANSVRARHLGRDIQTVARTIVGERVGVYAELLEESRAEAIDKMVEEARELGASGVVAPRLATSQIMGNAAEVLAYGTATIEVDPEAEWAGLMLEGSVGAMLQEKRGASNLVSSTPE